MPTYSIIKKSQLEGALRLDAEYYQPEYLGIEEKLQTFPHTSLKHYAEKVFSGPFGSTLKSESYQETGIPFIRISDIGDLFIENQGLVFISPSEHERIHSTYLSAGDIVLSKIGTVGRLSVISDELGEVNISENNIGIRLSKLSKEKKIALLFLLLSKYGQDQLLRKASGNIQLKLNVSDVESIKVPIFEESTLKELEKLYTNFLSKRNESNSLYTQAENLLLEELGLKDFESDGELWSVVMLSEVKTAGRMDAEYFQPKYEKLFKGLKKNNPRLLGDLATMQKGVEPGSEAYSEEGKLFIRVSSISKFGLADKDQKYISDKLYQELKEDYEPKVGEILLTKDASPGIACVLDEKVEGIVSGGVLRLKIKEDIDSEYLTLCINSVVGQLQAERDAGGSIIAHWKSEQVKQVQIPVLPIKTQQKIAELVRTSHVARKKAKELLEEAKRKVEELIEAKTR
jgi:restriction endonuclease S subunit